MNKQRRQELNNVIDGLDTAMNELAEIQDDEQQHYDNLPESFQYTDRGQAMLDAIDWMDGVANEIDNLRTRIEKYVETGKE